MHEDKNRERAARQWAHDEFYFGEKPGTQPFVENTVDSRDSQRFVSNDKGSHGIYSECLTHGCKSYINQLDSDCGFFSNAETDVQLEGARKASVLPSVVGNFDDHSIEKENWSNKIDTEAKFYGKREHPGSKINTKFTSWLQDVPHYRSITSQQLRSQEISQWSDHYVENGQQKKIKSKGLDETYIDDPCKLNESLNKIQDTQDHASPNDIQEPHAHVSKSNINEHIILQPALYLRPEACTKFDGNHFNRPMRMPSKDLNSGVTTNQVNENPAAESRGFSEFENSAMHPSEPPREEHKIPDSKLTRWQASHWNKVCADMPVWGSQGIDEIPSAGTALGHILISKDDAVANKSGLKHISSKQRDDNLDNERRVRSRVEQLGGIGESVKFIRPGHSRTIRPTSGKDRHSKVNTSKGPRDRRVRLSVPTAVQFYDVQDRLGYDQPSKAVEWLMKNAKAAIDELWQLPFTASTESPSKTSFADSSLHESSHDQLSSTSASFNNTLTPPAPPSVLRSISQFERECNQSIVIQECGAQSRNEKSDSKQIITGTSIGENDEHTTEHLNSNVHAELNNKSKGEAKKPAEENHVMIISRDNTTRCKTDSTSATASFGGHQLHQSPPRLNASYFYTRDIQPSLINYSAAQEPAHPWHVILNKTDHHQERSKGLETLSQSHTYKPIQGAYPQYFDYSYAKLHQSAEEAIIQNSFYKAANNSQVSTGFEKHGTVSANIFSDSKNNMCSCTTTSTRVLSSYRDDNAMFRTPSTSQFCPVTNSAARTPAMHYVSDRTFKHPTVNTLLPSNPSTLSSAGTSFSLKQKVYLEGLIQQQDHVTRSPNWLSGILDQNTFLNLPSRINTISSSIFAPYSTNNFAEDVTAIPGTLSSSKELNSFTHIGHNVLQSSEDTCPSHLILRSQIPARIQGFDELPDVMERAPQ